MPSIADRSRRERMRPARLAESPHQRRLGRLEEDQDRVQVLAALELPVDPRELVQHLPFADVDDNRRARDLGAGSQRQLGEHRQQRDRQVVDAEIAEVLERADRLRLAGTREAGQHHESRRRPPVLAARRGGVRRFSRITRSSPPDRRSARCALRARAARFEPADEALRGVMPARPAAAGCVPRLRPGSRGSGPAPPASGSSGSRTPSMS